MGEEMQQIIAPFTTRYDGNDTKYHVIDAQQYGQSVLGAAKIYNAVSHYCYYGNVPRGNYKKQFFCYSKVPKEGSYDTLFILIATLQQYQLFGDLYKEAFGFLFAKVLDGLHGIWTGRSKGDQVVEKLTDTICEQARHSAQMQEIMVNGIIGRDIAHANLFERLHGKLIDTLPALANGTHNSAKDMVTPIGRSCKSMNQFHGTPNQSTLDEPDAEVIRSNQDLEVGDMDQYKCNRISEVNVKTGHCQLDVDGVGTVNGKINDPTLEVPDNVYTRALNKQSSFSFSAKPVTRHGEVHKLYISDAKDDNA